MMMVVLMVVMDGDDDGEVVDRSIDVEESHSVGHMQTEYEIWRPNNMAKQNRGDINICATKLPTRRPLQSRYNKQLVENNVADL